MRFSSHRFLSDTVRLSAVVVQTADLYLARTVFTARRKKGAGGESRPVCAPHRQSPTHTETTISPPQSFVIHIRRRRRVQYIYEQPRVVVGWWCLCDMVEGRHDDNDTCRLSDMILLQQQHHKAGTHNNNNSMETMVVQPPSSSRLQFTPFFIENILQGGCQPRRSRSRDTSVVVRTVEDVLEDEEDYRSPGSMEAMLLEAREEPLDLCKARRRGGGTEEVGSLEGARQGGPS